MNGTRWVRGIGRKVLGSRLTVLAAVLAVVGGGLGVMVVSGAQASGPTVYYACLKKGLLSSVGTRAPACPTGARRISWNRQGPPGLNGKTIRHGAGRPANTVGVNGDFYLDTTAMLLYGPKAGGVWPPTGSSLVGPAGTNGNTLLHGSGAPSSAVGVNGDFYLDTTAMLLYGPKSGGAWPATGTSLVGPTGALPTPDLKRVATLNWWGGAYSGAPYGFNGPDAVAFDGTHLWVTNYHGSSVTEMNAADGSWVRTLSGGSYTSWPTGVAFDGTHLWVTNYGGDSVTEINAADGSRVRTLSGGSYGFNDPFGVAFDGAHLWVTNRGGNSVTEINAADGTWVRTLSAGSYGFDLAYGVAFDGSHVWVTNYGGNSVTEINAADGSWVRTLSGGSYGFDYPIRMAFDGTHLWVTNNAGNSVTEINAADGSWVRTLSAGSYGFNWPEGVAFDGAHLWVTNSAGNSVTEINAADGSWVRTLSAGSYGFNGPVAVAFDGTHLWVANNAGNSVTSINAG